VATAALELPTFSFLKRNYLFKFETSMLSSSVTYNLPFGPQAIPKRANIFTYSHPRAPAPTKNVLTLIS